jgi:hypothetical protein
VLRTSTRSACGVSRIVDVAEGAVVDHVAGVVVGHE